MKTLVVLEYLTLYTKFQGQLFRRRFLKFFTIYGHGRETWNTWTNFHSPHPMEHPICCLWNLAIKMVKVNSGSSYENIGSTWVPDAVYKVSRSTVPKKIFEIFHHKWAWSWDLEHLNKFSLPTSHGASHLLLMKFGFNWPSGFRAKEVWKCWIRVTLDEGQWMTLTFDIHKGSCTHLVDWIFQLWYHRLQ